MRRVTYKTVNERKNNSQYQDLPKLKDILVDLKVTKDNPQVVRNLRLIGIAMEFTEYTAKKRIPKEEQVDNKYFVECEFPDAERNKSFTRIGHDNPDLCPWRKEGYIGTKKYAIRCLEKQSDGSWSPKILCKGPSIFDEFFNWEQGRVEELENEDDVDTVATSLGGEVAPIVKITANYNPKKLGNVEYKVHVGTQKMITIDEDLINILRAVREPSADELNKLRAEYKEEREAEPSLPEWRDWYEFSYDIRRIFQYTPPKLEENSSSNNTESSTNEEASFESNTEDEETQIDVEDLTW